MAKNSAVARRNSGAATWAGVTLLHRDDDGQIAVETPLRSGVVVPSAGASMLTLRHGPTASRRKTLETFPKL